MNDFVIAIIIEKTSDRKYELSRKALESINVPKGYLVQYYTINKGITGKERNKFQEQHSAQYYLYITDSIIVLDDNILFNIVEAFKDDDIGAVGVIGAQSLSLDGIYCHCNYQKGKFIFLKEKNDFSSAEIANSFNSNDSSLVDVRVLHPEFIAITNQFHWIESFSEIGIDVSALCREITTQEYRIVVINADKPQIGLNDSYIIMEISAQLKSEFISKYGKIYEDAALRFYHDEQELPYHVGKNVNFFMSHRLAGVEGISIGEDTEFQKDCWLMLPFDNYAGFPRLIIGRGCEIGHRCHIHAVNSVILEDEVLLASDIHISDHNHEYRNVGTPIKKQGVDSLSNKVRIGFGSWIGNNVVIAGNIDIGEGCVIGANTVLTGNVKIPDYCVVAGAPGRIVKVYDAELNAWVKLTNQKDLEKIIATRSIIKEKRPLLTVGIPTYNRLQYLKVSLEAVLKQAGNNSNVEILVSDNLSTDETAKYVKKLTKRYRNLRYHCHEENIGGDRNFLSIYLNAKGKFALALGDDDNLENHVIDNVLDILEKNSNISLLQLLHQGGSDKVILGKTVSSYMKKVSFNSTFISGLIFNTDLLKMIPNLDAEINSSFNQVYLTLSLIKKYENYGILCGQIFRSDSGAHNSSVYSLGEIFIQRYLDIIKKYASLTKEELSQEKKKLLEGMILPWCVLSKEGKCSLITDDIFKYYDQYYKDEEYYIAGKSKLKE
ncbi:MAG: glycosyltransferase, partial [Selenomonadales bacterium]|nr:glycosyltransferase [Selenomonadales bacterium]